MAKQIPSSLKSSRALIANEAAGSVNVVVAWLSEKTYCSKERLNIFLKADADSTSAVMTLLDRATSIGFGSRWPKLKFAFTGILIPKLNKYSSSI